MSGRAAPDEVLLDPPALAARLSITERHVRRLVAERRIPFVKVGRFVRFEPSAIARWLSDNAVDVASCHSRSL